MDDISYDEGWTDAEKTAASLLDSRYFELPFNQNGVFPQSIKFVFPPTAESYETFNNVNNLPDNYSYYEFPLYNETQLKNVIITLTAKETSNGVYTVMKVKLDGVVVFNRKVVKHISYNIEGYCEIAFDELDIKSDNINPENLIGGDYGSKVKGGVRLKQ